LLQLLQHSMGLQYSLARSAGKEAIKPTPVSHYRCRRQYTTTATVVDFLKSKENGIAQSTFEYPLVFTDFDASQIA
jgi:hypothetical protein